MLKNEFLQLYQEELSAIRQSGEVFADKHPKMAGRLKLNAEEAEDPFVRRLVESVAFLTARLRYHLQAEMRTLESDLVSFLYPHYFLPIPSMGIVRIEPTYEATSLEIFPPKTELQADLAPGKTCFFQTVYPVTARPFSVSQADYQKEGPGRSVLKITLLLEKPIAWSALLAEPLRFFIQGREGVAGKLYALLMGKLNHLKVGQDLNLMRPLPAQVVQPVGFQLAESLLPYPENSFSGYRLLTEYFAYPEKFSFFDITGLETLPFHAQGEQLHLHFYLDEYDNLLEEAVNQNTFVLNCTPIINLVEVPAESVPLTGQRETYPLVPADKTIPGLEIYQVASLACLPEIRGQSVVVIPYFGKKRFETKDKNELYLYWHVRQSFSHHEIVLSEFNFSLVDEQTFLKANLLCSQGELPQQLPYGGDRPKWRLMSEGKALQTHFVRSVKPFSSPSIREASTYHRVELVHHLYASQLGFSNPEQTLSTLKELLKVYSFAGRQGDFRIEYGLVSATATPITVPHPDPLHDGVCRCIHYEVTLDESHFPDQDFHLLGSLLSEFLRKSCSINAVVQLSFSTLQRGAYFTWPPQFGTKPIL